MTSGAILLVISITRRWYKLSALEVISERNCAREGAMRNVTPSRRQRQKELGRPLLPRRRSAPICSRNWRVVGNCGRSKIVELMAQDSCPRAAKPSRICRHEIDAPLEGSNRQKGDTNKIFIASSNHGLFLDPRKSS